MSTCRVHECVKDAKAAHGLCWTHYNRFRRYGHPQGVPTRKHPVEVVLERVDQRGIGCWLYDQRSARHPRITVDGQKVLARYPIFEWYEGRLMPGTGLKNLCGNTSCVRPDHHRIIPRVKRSRRIQQMYAA